MKITVYENHNTTAVYTLDKDFVYLLAHSGKNKTSGLKCINLKTFIEQNSDHNYHLASVQVGFSNHIDFSVSNNRIIYIQNNDTIGIVPLLHRSTISFMGMGPREDYLSAKVLKDKFLVLSKRSELQTYSIISGKMISSFDLKKKAKKDFSKHETFDDLKFQTYKQNFYNFTLLTKGEKIMINEEEYFKKMFPATMNMSNQVSFLQKLKKCFKEFEVIEIINDELVEIKFKFVHPVYEGY